MSFLARFAAVSACVLVFASSASAAEAVATGKVKGVDAGKKQMVLTDSAGKDWTIKLGDDLLINRDGKEVGGDLKTGDEVCVAYEKGLVNWTAHYVLVHEGTNMNARLVEGAVKNYDADRKEITFTDSDKRDWTFPVSATTIKVDKAKGTVNDIKIGDRALAIVDKAGNAAKLESLMIYRR